MVELPANLTVKDLAEKLNVGVPTVIKELIALGVLATINQTIDYGQAKSVADNLGAEVIEQTAPQNGEDAAGRRQQDIELVDDGHLITRPPIVTIMGHVDHGKTSLLDAIRQTKVAEGEAGGITQHIGAYQVEIHGQKITFLDTPGHEAFTAMRARGAQATDVAILVVAADDGVQPQTIEAIGHAKAAKVPIIVAINKVDKIDAQPDRVKQQLSDYGVIVEEWGGETVSVHVSARRKEGIDQLLEMILLVSEIADLKADPTKPAQGVVVEAKLDKNRGPLATVLVHNGTLHQSDNIVVGPVAGKIRAMFSDSGKRLKQVGPSAPAEILGLTEVPAAGEPFRVAPDEKTARAWAAENAQKAATETAEGRGSSLEDLSKAIQAGEAKDLNIVLKVDVQGSIQPLRESLENVSTDEVKVRILHASAGNITDSDVLLAQASNAIVIGFNVRAEPGAKKAAEIADVDIRHYSIIYAVIEDVEKALTGLLEPKFEDVVEGHAEVRQTFKIGRVEQFAGCMVVDGRISRSSSVRLIRAGAQIFEGKISSLRRFKDDARDVAQGYECGIGLEGMNDLQTGDIIESYRKERVNH